MSVKSEPSRNLRRHHLGDACVIWIVSLRKHVNEGTCPMSVPSSPVLTNLALLYGSLSDFAARHGVLDWRHKRFGLLQLHNPVIFICTIFVTGIRYGLAWVSWPE